MRFRALLPFSLVLAHALHAAPIRSEVAPDSLLVSLQGIPHGGDLPGVYALDSDGALRLVVPYGREPRWSPDRRRIALIGNREHPDALCCVDVRNSTLDVVSPARAWADMPWLPNEFSLRPKGLCWAGSSGGVVAWGSELTIGPMATPTGSMLCPFLVLAGKEDAREIPRNLVAPRETGKADGVVGRVSFGPEGAFAYEWYGRQAWLGGGAPEVWLHHAGGRPDEKLALSLPGSEGLMNPLWSPDGKWLAVDSVGSGGSSRVCVIVSADRSRVKQLVTAREAPGMFPIKDVPRKQKNTAGVEWSPDGKRMLVKETPMAHIALGQIGVVEIDGDGDVQGLGGMDYDMQACWSPDGRWMARLHGDGLRANPYTMEGAAIWIVEVGVEKPAMRAVRIPKGLKPISIDW